MLLPPTVAFLEVSLLRATFLSRALSCFHVWRTQGHTFQRPCIPLHKSAHVSLLSSKAFSTVYRPCTDFNENWMCSKGQIFCICNHTITNRMNMCTYCSYNDRSLVSDAMQLNKISAHMHFATKKYILFMCSFPFSLLQEWMPQSAFIKKVLYYAKKL